MNPTRLQRPPVRNAPRQTVDVMAGPANTFRPLAPAKNTPRALLLRPGLGLGTKMG